MQYHWQCPRLCVCPRRLNGKGGVVGKAGCVDGVWPKLEGNEFARVPWHFGCAAHKGQCLQCMHKRRVKFCTHNTGKVRACVCARVCSCVCVCVCVCGGWGEKIATEKSVHIQRVELGSAFTQDP